MSAPIISGSLGADVIRPNLLLDWCLAHYSIDPSRKRKRHRKTEPAVENQTPMIDITFWGKKRLDEQTVVPRPNEAGKQVSGATAENVPAIFEHVRDDTPDNIGKNDSALTSEERHLPIERPNHPRWSPKGSTIVRINGRDIDLAALPECTCRPFFVNYRQLEIRQKRNSHDVSPEQVAMAHRIWNEKEDACLYCCHRFWCGFSRMRDIALERQFQAQLPSELRLKRGRRRKLYQD